MATLSIKAEHQKVEVIKYVTTYHLTLSSDELVYLKCLIGKSSPYQRKAIIGANIPLFDAVTKNELGNQIYHEISLEV